MLGRIVYTREWGRPQLERERYGPLELVAAVFFDRRTWAKVSRQLHHGHRTQQ